jgi:hypothetical protein
MATLMDQTPFIPKLGDEDPEVSQLFTYENPQDSTGFDPW